MEIFFFCLLVVIVAIVIIARKLTIAGGICGGLLAIIIYLGTGLSGVCLLAAFFIAGTSATSWKKSKKVLLAAADTGPRTASQVFANGGVAGLVALPAIFYNSFAGTALILIACCFSAATADTLSSELGTIYGRTFFNIITLKPDQRGEDGVVSTNGFIIGIAGSCMVALVYLLMSGSFYTHALIIVLSGTIGNITDSIAGALLERKGLIKNDGVNLINTIVATGFGWLMLGFS